MYVLFCAGRAFAVGLWQGRRPCADCRIALQCHREDGECAEVYTHLQRFVCGWWQKLGCSGKNGDNSVVRAPHSWSIGCGFKSLQERWENFFSRVNFLCWLLLRYPFHPRFTGVARKRSRSFCQKCRWQVTAKHVCTLRYVALHEVTWYGAWLYGETAAVSCGTSHVSAVSTPHRWIFKNAL